MCVCTAGKVPFATYPTLLNQKFLPQYLEGDNKEIFAHYLRAWSELGIWHIQFNVVSKETLLQAQAHPDKFTDLIVRVAGYSAYFVDLPEGVQNDIDLPPFLRFQSNMKLDSFSGGRSSQLYDAKFLKELRALIEDDNSKDIIKRIETERDKFISHNEYPSHHLQTTVSFKKAKRFLNILLDMLDKISVKYDGASY